MIDPEFTVKMEGHSYAHFGSVRDTDAVKTLCEFLRRQKWRGQLLISFTGNGGIQDAVFHEVRKASLEKT